MANASGKPKPSSDPSSEPSAAVSSAERLLDAAERLLIEAGYSAVTTRQISQKAGLNHGLIHYYYGSMEELFLAVLERFTARLIARQRAMYAAPTSFLVKWRKAMEFLEEDLAAGYPKIWMELQAMGWNRPEMRARLAAVHEQWTRVLTEAFTPAMKHYRLGQGPLRDEAMVALVASFYEGMVLERLSGVSRGHAALLRSIDCWLGSLEKATR